MERGLFACIRDRAVANARVLRGAPEAVGIVGVITIGVSYFAFDHLHRERVTALNETIASQERLLSDYRTKLKGATPDEAASQNEKLTTLLADAQSSLSAAKSKPVSVENRSRDPRRLYADNQPIALGSDPRVDLDKKKITFPAVNADALLGANETYEFQDWKLTCGGTQLYSMISEGSGNECQPTSSTGPSYCLTNGCYWDLLCR
jgi:hypothetical protein